MPSGNSIGSDLSLVIEEKFAKLPSRNYCHKFTTSTVDILRLHDTPTFQSSSILYHVIKVNRISTCF